MYWRGLVPQGDRPRAVVKQLEMLRGAPVRNPFIRDTTDLGGVGFTQPIPKVVYWRADGTTVHPTQGTNRQYVIDEEWESWSDDSEVTNSGSITTPWTHADMELLDTTGEVLQGKRSYRVFVPIGEGRHELKQAHPPTDLNTGQLGRQFVNGDEVWIGYAVQMVDYLHPDAGQWMITQYRHVNHSLATEYNGTSPHGLAIVDDSVSTNWQWVTDSTYTNAFTSPRDTVFPVVEGRTLKVLFHVKWSPSESVGFQEVWMNDGVTSSGNWVNVLPKHFMATLLSNGSVPALNAAMRFGIYRVAASGNYLTASAEAKLAGLVVANTRDAAEEEAFSPPASGGGTTATVNQASETDTATVVGRLKTRGVVVATETDSPQAVTARKTRAVGMTTETDTVTALGRLKTRTVGQSLETDSATTTVRRKTLATGMSTETDTAQVVTRRKSRTVDQAQETDAAQVVNVRPLKVAVNRALESDVAQVVTRNKARVLGMVSETDTAQAISRLKRLVAGMALESDAARVITRVKSRTVGMATEADTASVTGRRKTLVVNRASETDSAEIIRGQGLSAVVGQVTESDVARALRIQPLLRVLETNTARVLGRVKTLAIARSTETDAAQAVSRLKAKAIGLVTNTNAAQATTRVKSRLVGMSTETDTARGGQIIRQVGRVTNTNTANTVAPFKGKFVVTATETDTARPIAFSKLKVVGRVDESDVARGIGEVRAVLRATESNSAQGITRRKTKLLATAAETDAARSTSIQRFVILGRATHLNESRTIFTGGQRGDIGTAIEINTATALTRRIMRWIEAWGSATSPEHGGSSSGYETSGSSRGFES